MLCLYLAVSRYLPACKSACLQICLRVSLGVNFCEQKIPRETVGHISSAGCKGQKEFVRLAHINVCRDLISDIARHQKMTSVKELTILGTEKTLGSLRQMEEHSNMCSKEDLLVAVAEDEAKTPREMGV